MGDVQRSEADHKRAFFLEGRANGWRRTDIAALAWRVGPPGRPIARGVDILTIRDGRVSAVRTLIAR